MLTVLIYPPYSSYEGTTHAEMASHTHAWLHSHYSVIGRESKPAADGRLIAYVIDADTLKIKDILELSSYEFKKDTEFADKSTLTIARQPNAEKYDYVVCTCEGKRIFTGIFSEYSSSSGKEEYKLTVLQKEKLFDRFVFIKNEELISSVGIEDFIVQTIKDNWISSGDSMLDRSYMTATAYSHTPVYAKVSSTVTLTDGAFNLKTYLGNALENYGIRVEFEITSRALNIYVAKDDAPALGVNANDTDVADYDETYSVDALTKLLVQWGHTAENSDEVTEVTEHEYYLLDDRTISTDKTAENRAKGSTKSKYIEAESEDEMYQSVRDEFSKNSYSHKISFDLYMDSQVYDYLDFETGRSCRINTKSGVRTSLVTSTSISSKSRFATIGLGKLKITLIEKIRSSQ